jgi:hypothetical protein
MRKYIAKLMAALSVASLNAKDIQTCQEGETGLQPPIAITGKLGFDMFDGEKLVIIDTDDTLVPGKDPAYWPMNGPSSYPAKRVAIFLSNKPQHKELWRAASEGKVVTLRGLLTVWNRSAKLGHPRLSFILVQDLQ